MGTIVKIGHRITLALGGTKQIVASAGTILIKQMTSKTYD